jgi:glucose/mannose-6-phosphate isomerase
MKKLIAGFGNQLRHALEIGAASALKTNTKEIRNVMITGLGGSGIGGTIVSELVAKECIVPISSNKGYDLPEYINENSLVICSSFSGNTEETLEAFEKAMAKGAEIACVTSGGELLELAIENKLNYIQLPTAESPRTMMGYSITQLFYLLNHYGLISDTFKVELNNASTLIDNLQEEIQADAERISDHIEGKTPIIYACDGYEGMAVRFRQQMNENAKMLCWHNIVPEMNHNELVGWRNKDENLAVIFFRNDTDYTRNQKRLEINKEVISKYTSSVMEYWSKGESMIEKTFYFVNVGDHVSYIISKRNGVVAEEIEVINSLKDSLSEF